MLLHVADASNPAAFEQIAVVYKVLEELGIQAKDTLLVLNKIDAVDRGEWTTLLTRYPHALPISAHTGQGIDELRTAVSQVLSHSFLDVDVETRVDNGRLLAMLSSHGEVLSRRYTDSRVIVHCRIPERALSHLRGLDTQIRPHGRVTGQAAQGNGRALAVPATDTQNDSGLAKPTAGAHSNCSTHRGH